jgi:hypothetical protein
VASISTNLGSLHITWQADVWAYEADSYPASVGLTARDQGIECLRIGNLTPDQADTIAAELVAAATRARRASARKTELHPDVPSVPDPAQLGPREG